MNILEIIEQKKPVAVGINIFSVNFELVKCLIERCKFKINSPFIFKRIYNNNYDKFK